MTRMRHFSSIAPLVRRATTRCGQEAVFGVDFEAHAVCSWLPSGDQRRHNSSFIRDGSAAASAAAPPGLPLSPLDAHPAPLHSLPQHPDSALPALATGAAPPAPWLPPTVAPEAACPLAAHTSLEDNLGLILSPTQLGVQLWEGAHAASGLPWWAAIPAATLALRAATLPLSLRAYAASSNVALLHRAVGLSRKVTEAVAEAEAQTQRPGQGAGKQQQQPAEAGASGNPAPSGSTGEGGIASESRSEGESAQAGTRSGAAAAAGGGGGGAGSLGRVQLVRRVLAQLRAQHGAPSFGWYAANAAVQIPLAVSLTLALRRMSESLWPGLTGEGLAYFKDLTAPPMYLETLSTPYGTAGTILPLALVLTYILIIDRSAGGSSPGIHTALKLLVLPLYCAALLQPHAVLLYWLALAGSQLGVYELAGRVPQLRRAAGVPEMLLPPQAGGDTVAAGAEGSGSAEGEGKGAADPLDLLLYALAESYDKAGSTAAARSCLLALLSRQPGHSAATQRLKELDNR